MIIFGAPFRYYQGRDILKDTGTILQPMGKKFFLVSDAFVFSLYGDALDAAFASAGLASVRGEFDGESSDAEINRLHQIYKASGCDAVVGVGGGKALDTAKGVSIVADAPVALVPTTAASDAPVSNIAMIYKADHSKDRVAYMRYSPWCIIMDTEVILKAPLRTFISGIGDAAATKFEADACLASGAANFLKGRPPRTAKALCDLCWDIIREHAMEAVESVKNGVFTNAFDEVVEASALLSGLGFVNGGLAAGHAVSSGLTSVPAALKATHGELVSFGLLVQLVLEKRPQAFMDEMLAFLKGVGLPTTLAQLGVTGADKDDITKMVNKICTPQNLVYNMPCEITPAILEKAIYEADRLGR
ncbi:Iron-containing alcohol dehydrogenase [uncultured delta proteobacterium]|uniref:Glycerol dehydrogenase n=1 Tax=uncultured delta proteobacterium TaxID=34034 RepID=A0A212K4S8_9DELT|nr:Iron-containing alcohol dehydrogenase [uncultured delta proteobacterium]